jgi:hypothetical protein
MTYKFDELDCGKFCDLSFAEIAMRLIVEDFQKPSIVAESALTSALTLIKNIDDEKTALAFADKAERLIERLRSDVG